MTPDQNPPVEPAALAAAAETKVLPRGRTAPEGYRYLLPLEIVTDGDMIDADDGEVRPAAAIGHKVLRDDMVRYIRPIDPVPHTEGRPFDWTDPGHRLTEAELDAVEHAYWASKNGVERSCLRSGLEAAVRAFLAFNRPAPQAPEGTSPKASATEEQSGIDIGSVIGNITSLRADLPLKDTAENHQRIMAINTMLRAVRESHAAQVSTLTDALTKAREALADLNIDKYAHSDAVAEFYALLESPALADLTQSKGAQA